jgi:alpha-L-fucosidase
LFIGSSFCPAAEESGHAQRTKQQALEKWRDRRFGVFIHWNPSSILELYGGSWIREGANRPPFGNKTQRDAPPAVITNGDYLKFKRKRPVPQEIYDNLFHKFDPENFNAREWAKLIKEAGAGYVIFTSKHHDGFCTFDTKFRDYNIMRTPFGRDICKELIDACREEGLMFFFYYSVADWWDPDYTPVNDCPYVENTFLPQINELLTNYGPVDGFWWDGSEQYGKKAAALIQSKQPWIIQNERLGGGAPSDFSTPENRLGLFRMDRPWESCITMTGEAWFWNGGVDYKTATTCLRYLISCAVGNGNLALDVGPRGDGQIDERAAANLREMGGWLAKYGESIRGTRGGPYKPSTWGGATRSGNKIFLHITAIIENKELTLPVLPSRITGARCLTGGSAGFSQTEKGVTVRFSQQEPMNTVVELTLSEDAMAIQPIDSEAPGRLCLSDDMELQASSIGGRRFNPACLVLHKWENPTIILNFGEPGYELQQARLTKKPARGEEGFGWSAFNIGYVNRYWQAAADDKQPWVELDLNGVKTVSEICFTEQFGYTESFACDAWVNGEWKTLFTDGEMGFYNRLLATPVKASKLRIRFQKFNGPPGLSRIRIY